MTADRASWLAAIVARMALDDDRRWAVLDLVGSAAAPDPAAGPTGPAAVALRSRLRLVAHEAPVDEALAAVLADDDAGFDVVDGPVIPVDADLEAIRAHRPWPTNPLYVGLIAGTLPPEVVAAYVDQWRIHLAFGPALFAGILGNLAPGDPDHERLCRDVAAPTRRELGVALRRLRTELVGDPGVDHPSPRPETAAHLAIMGEITRRRSPVEAFAAVYATKPGFSATCAAVVDSLRANYGISAAGVEFFARQRDRGDEGEAERAAIERAGGATPRIRTAFRDGLYSYHLVLDGVLRHVSRPGVVTQAWNPASP